ncbi:MAG: kynureninase [Flavobacteriales bacterium]|jgi:kynureninase|nr:kynureninase [Flavobacteriales bacterium]|tara:strand:+ start:3155 stop:4423 length:1269 start_codon:yes stop_codon:yes gene_type:complete
MNKEFDINFAREKDLNDPISKFRNEFNIPRFKDQEAVYFTGNSLGLQPKNYNQYLEQELLDWKSMAVEGHFHAKTPWFDYHKTLTKDVAYIVGAKEKEVVTMNALSVNLHLLLTSFYQPTHKKYKILCEPNLFPSDLYILHSQIELRGFDIKDSIVFAPIDSNGIVNEEALLDTIKANQEELAMIFIGGVNYYTGQVFDMEKITKMGHLYNIIVGFDLAHAVGNINLKLHDWGVDFAAWCSYKYLNSGPGNVSSIFIHENQIKKKPFRLSGWWGHQSDNRFALQKEHKPIHTAEGWQLSNAPIFGMSIYRVSLQFFTQIGFEKLIVKRIQLSRYLESAIHLFNSESNHIKLNIITPGTADKRGAQLSVHISDSGKEIYNSLKKSGVYVDWRDPNVMRISPVPLYNSFEDVAKFYHILHAFNK